jgi:hypothetical protein
MKVLHNRLLGTKNKNKKYQSAGVQCDVDRWKSIDVSEEHVNYIFKVEKYAKQEISTEQVGKSALLVLLRLSSAMKM